MIDVLEVMKTDPLVGTTDTGRGMTELRLRLEVGTEDGPVGYDDLHEAKTIAQPSKEINFAVPNGDGAYWRKTTKLEMLESPVYDDFPDPRA